MADARTVKNPFLVPTECCGSPYFYVEDGDGHRSCTGCDACDPSCDCFDCLAELARSDANDMAEDREREEL